MHLGGAFYLNYFQNAFDKRARERKWSRTLSSMRRLRLNKDEEENDGRGDLSSAIVASIATEQTNDASKPASSVSGQSKTHNPFVCLGVGCVVEQVMVYSRQKERKE